MFFSLRFFPPLRRFSTRNLTTRFILQYPTFYFCSCPLPSSRIWTTKSFPALRLHTHARLSPCSCFILLTTEFSNSSVISITTNCFPVHQTRSIKTAWPAVLRGSPRYYLTYLLDLLSRILVILTLLPTTGHNTCGGSKSIIRLLC